MSSPVDVINELTYDRLYLNGSWQKAHDEKTFIVWNPADGSQLGTVADSGAEEIHAAIASAKAALPLWKKLSGHQRFEIMGRAIKWMQAHQDELALVLCQETGKPLHEAKGEVVGTIRYFEWYSHEALRIPGEYWQNINTDRKAIVLKEPAGVVAAITPWNFPLSMLACKVAPALAAGCTVLLKPAELTPLTSLLIARAFESAGLPAGVLNVLPTSNSQVFGNIVTESRDVALITFTGSQRVGELLFAQSAKRIKKVLLELGGNAPAIVLDTHNLENTVTQLVRARYLNAGQACVAANRFYVHEKYADEFIDRLVAGVQEIAVRHPLDPQSQMGPLINATSVHEIEDQIGRAVSDGAALVTGGSKFDENSVSAYFKPAVLVAEQGQQPAVFSEEIFGPVASVTKFSSLDEAIALANDSDYGLASYVFGQNDKEALYVAESLECGSVGVNCALISDPSLPFGGVKTSGNGRERGRAGLEEYLELKSIQIQNSAE